MEYNIYCENCIKHISTVHYVKKYRDVECKSHLSPEQASRMGVFLNISVLQGEVFSTSPKTPSGGPPLVSCPRLLKQFIRSYPPYRRPFLYPQPEDAPCRGFVLYGCEPWSLTLREVRRLRLFKNMVLRRIFGPRRDEVTGEWRRLHNER